MRSIVPGHIRLIARRKVMGFVLSEEGRVGSRTALSTATLIAISSLAALMLAPRSTAVALCGDNPCFETYCCFDAIWDKYICTDEWDPNLICWIVNP